MITIDETPRPKQNGTYEFSFKGLSGDAKPTGEYEGQVIANGSVFLELDTMNVMMYDEAGERWV